MKQRSWIRSFGWVLALVAGLALGTFRAAPAFAQAKPLKIGFSMAQSGGLAGAGKGALLAMQIWAEEVNAKGGILGRKVELVFYDDHTKGSDVPAIYTKLITVDKVDFVVSPYGSALIAPSMPVIMQHKMVYPALFGLDINKNFNYPHYYQIMPSGPDPYIDWSAGYFQLANEMNPKPKTVAILVVDNEYGVNAQGGVEQHAKKYGLQVVLNQRYPPTTTDFTPIVRSVKAANPDIVWVSSYPPDSVGIVKAAKEVGLKPKMCCGGMVGLQFTSIQQNFAKTLNGIINYAFWVPEPTLKFPGIEQMLKKYHERAVKESGVDPLGYYLSPFSYAYVQVLQQAIEGTKGTDQMAVSEYIRSREFDTVVGKVKFAPNGEWAKSRMLYVQFRGIQGSDLKEFSSPGKMPVLFPKEWKSGDAVYPFPGWE